MSTTLEREETTDQTIEHFDVVIVGAGISGIGTAYHLQNQNPGRSFVMLEAQDSFGGTWHTHRYPGIRSDSDLYTFGYRFKPWTSARSPPRPRSRSISATSSPRTTCSVTFVTDTASTQPRGAARTTAGA